MSAAHLINRTCGEPRFDSRLLPSYGVVNSISSVPSAIRMIAEGILEHSQIICGVGEGDVGNSHPEETDMIAHRH
jgi:hypothetical protein